MGKVISEGFVPKDDPMFREGVQVFTPGLDRWIRPAAVQTGDMPPQRRAVKKTSRKAPKET